MVKQAPAEWFLAPRDIKPGSTLVLGKIIADPRYPSAPPHLTTIPIETEIVEVNYPWSKREEHGKGGKVGVFTSFLSMFGIGVDTSGSLQLDSATEINVEELQILTFQARSDYVQQILDLPANVNELRERNSKRRVKPLYIITGIRIAKGGTVTTSSNKSWSGETSVGVSPNVPGLNVGVKGGLNRSTGTNETIGKHDFVYAFKLSKITYSQKYPGAVSLEGHTKGAAFDYSDKIEKQTVAESDAIANAPVTAREPSGFQVMGVQSQDAGTNEFGVEGVEIPGNGDGDDDDENQACYVIDPSLIQDDSSEEDEDDD